MPRFIKHLSWFLPVVAAVILILFTKGHSYHFNDFRLTTPSQDQYAVEIPFLVDSAGIGDYTLSGNMVRSWFSATSYQLIPDDYLKSLIVNGRTVDLSGFSYDERTDVENGFKVELKDYLVVGYNKVELIFEDFGGDMGMDIRADKSGWQFAVLIFGWLAIAVWIFVVCAQKVGVSKIQTTLYFLILLGSIIQVWYIFTYNPADHIWSDPARHWEQGTDLLRIDLMSLTDPIGYQVYVAVIAKLTLKIPELVAFYASCLAMLGAWIWYRFVRELQADKTLALCAWACFSLLPSWSLIYGYFMQETLFLPLLGAALWGTWRCRRKADVRSFGLMIFLWVIAGLTRGIAIPLAAVVCTWLWLVQDHKMPKATYSTLIILVIMGPLTYRAYSLVDHFAPHGMGHLNVVYAQSGKQEIKIKSGFRGSYWEHGFGSPSTGETPFAPFSDWKTQRKGQVRISIDLDEGTHDWSLARKAQNMGLKDYLWITKENFIFLFFGSSWPDNNPERFLDRINIGLRFIWAPLFIVLIIGLALHFRKFKGQWMLPTVLGTWFLVQCVIPISLNEGRYRKPFEGIAIAQVVLWLAVMRGQTRPAAPGTPLSEYLRSSRAYIDRKRREWLPEKNQPDNSESE